MKLSKVIHLMSLMVGVVGALALFGAWAAGDKETVLGLTQTHLFYDAIILELIAIAASVCTLVRLDLEAAHPVTSPLI